MPLSVSDPIPSPIWPSSPATNPAPKTMNTAIPFAVDDRNTEPSSDTAATTTIPATSPTPAHPPPPRPREPIGPPAPRNPRDHDRCRVEQRHVQGTHDGRPGEAAEQQLRASQRAHDQRLQQPPLGVAPYGTQGEEHGQHRHEE